MSQPGDEHETQRALSAASKAPCVDALAKDLVERWHRGERVPTEAYLQRHPDLESHAAFELVLTEVILRQEFGQPPALEEFVWRFPQFADALRRHFAMHASFQEAHEAGSTVAESQRDLQVVPPLQGSRTVAGFELLEELGRGGMGVIYRAREISLGRDVALKFLPTEYANDPDRLERFMHEARTASALNHPNICTVHALGEHEGRPFIVMELVEGHTLQDVATRGATFAEIIRHVRQAARALSAAHDAGVVHRDIKPDNIMVRSDGYVKVLDFGLARRLPALTQGGIVQRRSSIPGTILGTVAYMSPEQARGEAAETASDIFSLGIVMYELITGEHPFKADSAWEMLHAISARSPVDATRLNSAIPAALSQLTEAMLQKDPRFRPTAAEVSVCLQAIMMSQGPRAVPAETDRTIVRRHPELAELRVAFEKTAAGSGSIVCVSGEPGIGKTTLVQDFLASLASNPSRCWIGRGHCSERLGDTEAYLPVIDALGDLLRGDESGTIARLMQLIAPTWHMQIRPGAATRKFVAAENCESSPTAVVPDSTPATPSARASSRLALLREIYNLVQEASRLGPVVLLFDDVHWADASTVDLFAYLGRHCQRLRLLIIATYRPTELLLKPHLFHSAKLELVSSGACTELLLGFLNRDDIVEYLNMAFPAHAFSADFADLVLHATEGNPLFMVDLLRYLRERGVIARFDGHWSLAKEATDLKGDLPGSILSLVQRKLDLLDADDRKLLAAGSVQGHEFDSAALAGALGRDAAHVEERLECLDRVHGLVRLLWEDEFADGALTLRYAFVHALYQHVLYTSLQPSRRAALSTALARALERHPDAGNAAPAELAYLYETGRDFVPAARNFWLAAQDAASVFAHREAIELARRGLRLLEYLPNTTERFDLELSLQTTLGMQLQVTDGFATREGRHAYLRARELCQSTSDVARLFPVLWGLWLYSKVRSELGKAQEMADELTALAEQLRDPDLSLQAYQALGMTAFCRGMPATALQHVERAAMLYNRERHLAHSYQFGQDPGVICKAFGAVALWLLGHPEQARQQSEAAIQMSLGLSPSSQAVALHFAAMLHQLRGDPVRVNQCANMSGEIAAEHGLSFWQAGSSVLGGWAVACNGSFDEGIRRLRQGLHDWNATDSITYRTYYLGLLAEVLRGRGEVDEGRRVVDEALALVEDTDERLYEAELYRLHGELRVADDARIAEDSFYRSLAIARQQQARQLELRAAMSLAALHPSGPRKHDARALLSQTLEKFTEGSDTRDIQDAMQKLEQLSK